MPKDNSRLLEIPVLLSIIVACFVPRLALFAAPAPAEATTPTDLCRSIEKTVNALIEYTHTTCTPITDHGAMSVILLSEKAIFSNEASKKGWLIVTVGAVANVLNAQTAVKTSDVFVTDGKLVQKRKGYKYPIVLARTLQRQTKAHQIGLEELYQQLNGALVATPLPANKGPR
jgi:hypothetical protein